MVTQEKVTLQNEIEEMLGQFESANLSSEAARKLIAEKAVAIFLADAAKTTNLDERKN